jgi:hypothetical protein
MNKLDNSHKDRLPSTERLMKLRVPSLFFAVAFAALSAQAQNPGATIDSVASDLAALAARVAKLEGQIVAADLVGTYALRAIQLELSGGAGSPAQVSSYVIVGTVTLNADGTVSISASPANGNTLSFTTPPSVSIFQGSGNGVGSTTWTYDNGSVTVVGGAPPLTVAAGGRVLVGVSANRDDGTDVLLILTRLQ